MRSPLAARCPRLEDRPCRRARSRIPPPVSHVTVGPMGTRIRGAVLAFAAALLVALSVPMAWWSGSPTMVFEGKPKVVKEMTVQIGLLSFEGCRGGGQCKTESHT